MSRNVVSDDPIESSYQRVHDFAEKHWRVVVIAAAVIVVAVVASMLVLRARSSAEATAQTLWLRAQDDLMIGETASAMDVTNELLNRHGGTPSGQRALLLKADILAAQGDLAEAERFYRQAIDKLQGDALLATSARRGLAVLLENKGDLSGAAAIYDGIGRTGEPEGGRIFDLRAAGRCYAALGESDKAIAAYQAIVDRYEGDLDRVARDYVHLAKVAIAEIE